jgi:SPP1 gp7 family putative phage head morphogenesis protein
MAATANAQIASDLTTHTVNILRVGADLRQAVFNELKSLEGELVAKIAMLPDTATVFTRTRLNALLAQTRSTIAQTYATIAANNGRALNAIAPVAEKQTHQAVNNATGVEVMSVASTPEQLEKIVSGQIIHGKYQNQWWSKQSVDLQHRFEVAMRTGMVMGEGIDKLVRRVRGTRAANYNDGIMGVTRAQAEALVRTSVISTANAARLLSFEHNQDVIKGLQWRSTLDNRTTETCIALDGKQWRLPDYLPVGHDLPFPGPTAHWNCRSTQIAVLRSWDELADATDPTPPRDKPRITTANIEKFRGKVNSDDLASVANRSALAFTDAPGAKMVPLSDLVSTKNELDDPAFRDGIKPDPRIVASNYMYRTITKGGTARAPLEVYENKAGTYTIIDGNATAQAAMLAGWKKVPVVVVEKPATVAVRINVEKKFRQNLANKGLSDSQIEAAVADKRITMDGVATAPETFDQFLRKQTTEFQNGLLGVDRAQMWRDGKITLTQLIDQTHRPLTVNELQAMIDRNQLVTQKQYVEGENGLTLQERGLLRQSLTHGIQQNSTLIHVYNPDTGRELQPMDTAAFPFDDVAKETKDWAHVAYFRNALTNTETFSPQEVSIFGRLKNFSVARLVTPDGRVSTLSLKILAKPGAIQSAAIKTPEGIFTGWSHDAARAEAERVLGKRVVITKPSEVGFVTNQGDFLDREAAYNRAIELKQVVSAKAFAGGELESVEFNRQTGLSAADATHISQLLTNQKNTNATEITKLSRAIRENGVLNFDRTEPGVIVPPVGTYRMTFDDIAHQRLKSVFTTPERLAKTIAFQARDAEPAITRDMIVAAEAQGGKLKGLENVLKTEGSLARKIRTDAADKNVAITAAAAKVSDAVRYTMTFPVSTYTKSVTETLNYFIGRGYTEVRFNNSWGPYKNGYAGYRGVNAKLTSPRGWQFEIQFHTPESLYVQEETPSHDIYKETPTTPEAILSRFQRLHALWKDVIVPEGADLLRQEDFK